MGDTEYDVIVIGTGPGGEGAAMQAAKGGKKVAIIERYSHIGGGCTHWGTIPSKSLLLYLFGHGSTQQPHPQGHWVASEPDLRAIAGQQPIDHRQAGSDAANVLRSQ